MVSLKCLITFLLKLKDSYANCFLSFYNFKNTGHDFLDSRVIRKLEVTDTVATRSKDDWKVCESDTPDPNKWDNDKCGKGDVTSPHSPTTSRSNLPVLVLPLAETMRITDGRSGTFMSYLPQIGFYNLPFTSKTKNKVRN